MPKLIAHTPAETDRDPQSLEEHLSGVAERASAFVGDFADPDWGRLAGVWHDLGKASPDWQAFIRRAMVDEEDFATDRGRQGPPHAPLGAYWKQ